MQTDNNTTYAVGVVYKKNLGHYEVHHHEESILCEASSKLWKQFNTSHTARKGKRRVKNVTEKHMDPIAIGDRVSYMPTEQGRGMILNVLPRTNYLARQSAKPMPGAHAFEQVIAANIDQVVPVFAAAKPNPRWHLLDRYLVTAESYEIPALIVITKSDLVRDQPEEDELLAMMAQYRDIGYDTLLTSALESIGINAFRQKMKGKRSVLVGQSGVGKTSLLNALEPDLGLRVKAVNDTTGKGRHTTTHLEMFPLAVGGAIIDTPGIREFGIHGLEDEDIAFFFPEIRAVLGQCKFGMSCQHDQEPGCAVREAVMDGRISPYRYKSFLRIRADR